MVKRSLTNLYNQLRELEASTDETTKPDRAKQLTMKLEALDKDFSAVHLDIIDLVDEEASDLEKEHEVMEKQKEDITSASLRLRTLLKAAPSSSDATHPLSRKLSLIKRCLEDTEQSLSSFDGSHVRLHCLSSTRRK